MYSGAFFPMALDCRYVANRGDQGGGFLRHERGAVRNRDPSQQRGGDKKPFGRESPHLPHTSYRKIEVVQVTNELRSPNQAVARTERGVRIRLQELRDLSNNAVELVRQQ